MDARLGRFDAIQAVPEPPLAAAMGVVPPRKPPTAVGAGMERPGDRGRDPRLSLLFAAVVSSLQRPVGELDLPAPTVARLTKAGVVTLGQVLGLSDDAVDRLVPDRTARRRLMRWRHIVAVNPEAAS